MKRIGVVGTGFIASGVVKLLENTEGLTVSRILSRRSSSHFPNHPKGLITNSVNDLIDNSDLVFEASGSAIFGTEVLEQVKDAKLPIITMNAELQVVV